MANSANGLRRVPRLGSAQERTSWTVRLPVGSYYWSVQALDAAYAGSSFGQEQTFEVLVATTRFTDIAAGLPGVAYGSVAWGDYDNDGDLDILLTGDSISRVYRNDGGGMFTDTAAGLTGVGYGSVAWGDYDNDGDLDILLTGASDVGQISRVYRNDGDGVFTDLGAALIGVEQGSGAWGDYDNDGDLDIVLTGYTGAGLISCVYRNEGEGVFTDIAAGLPGAGDAVAWGDYDHDGDLDILGGPRVYRNDGGGVFTDINAGLSDVSESSVAWGDYDNDGDLDFLLTGLDNTYTPISRVYRNDGPAGFTDIGAGLIGVRCGSVAWGDYDNDGDLDILLPAGISGYIAHAYRNDGGNVFTDIAAGLTGVPYSSAAWGDYDNDGDLDILLVGEPFSRVYRNDGTPPNTPPAAPTDLSAQTTGDLLTLFWSAAVDGQTPVSGLSYNLRVGTTPGGSEIMPAMAHAGSGYRRVVQLGNAQERTSWTITVPPRVCYWSVQSIDAAFAASPFAAEQSISPSGAEELAIPTRFLLRRCAPNPFTLATVVSFELPASSPIKLEVYEVSGRCVRTLVDEARAAGRHRTVWDGTDDRGRLLAGGTYFCRMVAREFNSTTRMTLIR
jgi:predicted nucleotidyltransferase